MTRGHTINGGGTMREDRGKLDQNQQEEPMSFIAMVIITGLVGGILWSALAQLAYIFNFTEVRTNVILEPWALGDWKKGWLGTLISIALIGGISIVAALGYYAVLRKFRTIWIAMGFGIALFVIVFFVLNPLFPGIPPIKDIKMNTLITSACFYILYGTFVGYSISYEANERLQNEHKEKEVPS